MLRSELKIAIRFTLLTTVLLGILYPLAITAMGHLALRPQADGEPDRQRRPGHRLTAHWPELLHRPVFSWTSFSRGQWL